jgi:hypothetical protein
LIVKPANIEVNLLTVFVQGPGLLDLPNGYGYRRCRRVVVEHCQQALPM